MTSVTSNGHLLFGPADRKNKDDRQRTEIYMPHEDLGNRQISSQPCRIIAESRCIARSPERLHQVATGVQTRYFYEN
ncbi:hypothetical protein AGR4A_Cc260140 [Agrobacterium tumefaciens str. B6]|uniref:Uncharacterized protein n=1 Tax=Agrobacterium tumefaciens str. B6 TaxID=1183423 RepID=A0A822UYM1_AGRTU|nr:hypothetical protein AGR4A_Cc260140 [Agrobacterium tumefaciens str. B6]